MNTQLSSSGKFLLQSSIFQHFSSLPDPRVERTRAHPLLTILAITTLAVIAGADGWVAIETFGKAKQDWLSQFLDLSNGVPSHDTFSRVLSRLDPVQFQRCFLDWIHAIASKLNAKLISIDGKTLKGSYDRENKIDSLQLVTAWASEHCLVLGQAQVDGKSNEIKAIPELLSLLDIEGCVITLDAMGCQKGITSQIIDRKGDYVIALKRNQGKLFEQVKDWFDQAIRKNHLETEMSYHEAVEGAHHRIESRQYMSVPIEALGELHNQEKWKGLSTVIRVQSQRKLWDKETEEVRYYISSLDSQAEQISGVIRSHWGIENSLHWTLDVTYREDESRIRKDHGPENLALLRRMTVSLLNQEKSFKGSQRMKRYTAAMDNEYLAKILLSTIQN